MIIRELINLIGFKVNQSQYKTAEESVNRLIGKMRNIGMGGSLLITAPFVALTGWLAKTMSDFEQLTVSFETMLGSAEKGAKLVDDMLQFAAKTPFEIREIGPAVKQLLAMGSSSEVVLEELKMLGDVAAGLNIPITRLGLNFGQVRTIGKLTGRELRDFATAGVPILDELAKTLGVSKSEIAGMVEKGKISFDMVSAAFKSMTTGSGKFANLMIKQSATLGGIWSNFKDMITLTAMSMSSYLLPIFKKFVSILLYLQGTFKNKLSPELKVILFWFMAIAAIIPPLLIGLSAFIGIGLMISKVWALLTIAATAHNVAVSAILLKYALLAAGFIAIIALIILLTEDFLLYTKGQDTMFGKILPPWKFLKEELLTVVDDVKLLWKTFKMFFEDMNEWIDNSFIGLLKYFDLAKNFIISIGKFKKGGSALESMFESPMAETETPFGAKENIGKFNPFKVPVIEPELPFGTLNKVNENQYAPSSVIKQINVNSNINTYVPVGTPTVQMEALNKQARLSVKETFNMELRNILRVSPEVE